MKLDLKFDKPNTKKTMCIFADTKTSEFVFYATEGQSTDMVNIKRKKYKSALFSEDFMAELTDAVRDYVAENPEAKDLAVVFVLPNNAVSMDTVNVPNMNKRRNTDGVEAFISGIYKNKDDLIINYSQSVQTKQISTYSITIANKEIVKSITSAITDGGMVTGCVTFVSNAITDAVSQLCPKLKGASYLMLDMKDENSVFTFVAKGKTVGFYPLPFGYSILQKSKLSSEDMLFDHSVAELAVLNAREKAKAKQLTVMQSDVEEEETDGEPKEENLDAVFGIEEDATNNPTSATVTYKTLPKKTPRKLPKFMLRPQPRTDEEYSYENFRIFMKWALTLIDSNAKLTSQGMPECIYVNMPEDLAFLFDMANKEKDENGFEFSPLALHGVKDDIKESLELFGGLFALQYNKNNNF